MFNNMLLNNNIQLNRNINLIMKIFLKQNNIITFAYFYNLSYINLYSLSISSYYTIYTLIINLYSFYWNQSLQNSQKPYPHRIPYHLHKHYGISSSNEPC